MEKKHKKIGVLALLTLAFIVCLSFASFAAEITDTWDSGNTTVTLDSDGVLTIVAKPGTDGRMEKYKYNTFSPWNNQLIQKIVIQDGVTYIGDYALWLTNTGVGELNLYIPDSVTELGQWLVAKFSTWGEIRLPIALQKATRCFEYSTVDTVRITGNYSSEVNLVFGFNDYTSTIRNIYIEDGVSYLRQVCYNPVDITVRLPNNDIRLDNNALRGQGNTILENMNTQKIYVGYRGLPAGMYTLDTLPNNIVELGYGGVVTITTAEEATQLLNRLENVTTGIFSEHTLPGTVIWPSHLTTIPASAFSLSTMDNIVIPEGVVEVGERAFKGTKLARLELPSTVKTLGEYSLSTAIDGAVTLPDTDVTLQGNGPFELLRHYVTMPKNCRLFDLNNYTIGNLCRHSYFNLTVEEGGIWDVQRWRDTGVLATITGELWYMREGTVIPDDITEVYYIRQGATETKFMFGTNVQRIHPSVLFDVQNSLTELIFEGDTELVGLDKLAAKRYFTDQLVREEKLVVRMSPTNPSGEVLQGLGYTVIPTDMQLSMKSGNTTAKYDPAAKTLTITGPADAMGVMEDYVRKEDVPWYDYDITRCTLKKVSYVGAHTFEDVTYPVSMGTSTTEPISVGESGFRNASSVYLNRTADKVAMLGNLGDDAFRGAKLTYQTYYQDENLYIRGSLGEHSLLTTNTPTTITFWGELDASKAESAISDWSTTCALISQLSRQEWIEGGQRGPAPEVPYVELDQTLKDNCPMLYIKQVKFSPINIDTVDWRNMRLNFTLTKPGTGYDVYTGTLFGASDIGNLLLGFSYGDDELLSSSAHVQNLWTDTLWPYLNNTAQVDNIYLTMSGYTSLAWAPPQAMLWVYRDTPTETFVKNSGREYKYIEDKIEESKPNVTPADIVFDYLEPKDVQFNVSLGEGNYAASGISSIYVRGKEIPMDKWTLSNDTVTISSEYLRTLDSGKYSIEILFDNDIRRSGVTIETINVPQSSRPYVLDKDLLYDASASDAVRIAVDLGEREYAAKSVTTVYISGSKISDSDWDFSDSYITLRESFLQTLRAGTYTLGVKFDNGAFDSSARLTILNTEEKPDDSVPPDALITITYEFYRDYPDYVIIPVQLNGATAITRLRIGTTELTEDEYVLQEGAIILDKDMLMTLDVGKYRVLPTFNDKANTTIPNIQLIVYEKAADRAAPYLLQSRIVFEGNPIVLKFDYGVGELQATNVLALIIDDDVILPTGERLPFTRSNINSVQKAYMSTLEIEDEDAEVATSSNATPSNATRGANRLATMMLDLDSPSNVFYVQDNEIVLDGAYVESLALSEGDHLIGAIFDNTERTTDVKKVILTIHKTNNPDDGDEPNPSPNPDDKPDVNPDDRPDVKPDDKPNPNPDEEDKPTPKPDDGDKPNPSPKPDDGDKPNPSPKPDDGDEPKPNPKPDNDSSGGGGSHGGSSSRPSGNHSSTSDVPNSGGRWEGSGNDWTYVMPDGSTPTNKWVGDGENWYYVNENGKLVYDWFCDPATGKWYMLNREHDGKFGAALKGWYYEIQDGRWYFLTPFDYSMFTGWGHIDKEWYYFSAAPEGVTYVGNNESGWKFDTTTALRPYGSMYVNENTPDGYFVDASGKYIK